MANLGYVVKSFVEERVYAYFDKIPKYVIEIGVFSNDKDNTRTEYETYTKKDGTEGKRKVKGNVKGQWLESDITNAQIMFIMENGSLPNHIPPRPVLQKTIDYAKRHLVNDAVSEGVQRYLLTHNIKDFENALEKMCIRMENYAKKGIRRKELDLAPNSPYTIKLKGSDIPLLDTGQLANSIKCVWKRI